MTRKIQVDFDQCESNAVCMGIAPEIFEVDGNGYLNILNDEVTGDNEDVVRESVSQCPKQAISIVDE